MFVLISHNNMEEFAIGIFTTMETADCYKGYLGGDNLTVVEQGIHGNYPPPPVCAAHRFDQTTNSLKFIGLYADFGQANNAAGPNGQVTKLTPDSPTAHMR
jgi:hypothetical protein